MNNSILYFIFGMNDIIYVMSHPFDYASHHIPFVISILINAAGLYFWIRRKKMQARFLEGRWEGRLICETNDNIDFACMLIVTRHKNKKIKACFHYETKQLEPNALLFKGVDRLTDGKDKLFTIFKKPTWAPKFSREMHINLQTNSIQNMPLQYDWNCTFPSIWKDEMTVLIKNGALNYSGSLEKLN